MLTSKGALQPHTQPRLAWRNSSSFLHISRTCARSAAKYKSSTRLKSSNAPQVAPDEEFDWALRYQEALRALPLAAGALGIAAVLLNRVVSGIAPLVDASSSQSRADVLVIGLSAVLVLTGLQWLSVRPKPLTSVEPVAEYVSYVDTTLPALAQQELLWAWQGLQLATPCRGVVIHHNGRCIMHCGMIKPGEQPGQATLGPICRAAMQSGRGNYLANLILFPGRVEFTSFFPENTQGVLVQPLGSSGILVAGSDTQRGFSRLDQAWIATITDKLDSTLSDALEESQAARRQQSNAAV